MVCTATCIQSVHVMSHTLMYIILVVKLYGSIDDSHILVFMVLVVCIVCYMYVLAHVDQYNGTHLTYTDGGYGYKSFFTMADASIVPLKIASLYKGIYREI